MLAFGCNAWLRVTVINKTVTRELRAQNIGSRITAGRANGFSFGHWLADTYGDAVEAHGHHEAQIMLVTAGPYYTTARGTQHPGVNALVFNPAQTWHHDRFLGPGSFFAVTMPCEFLAAVEDFELPREPSLVSHRAPRALLASLMRECARWEKDSALACEALCLELLAIVCKRAPNEHRAPGWLKQAVSMLEDEYSGPLCFSDISAAAGVHPVHLTRTFRKFLRCTPGEYLRARRLEAAARLLVESNLSLGHIAVDSGHADQSHLTRRFRESYGMTPGEYRTKAGGLCRHHQVCSVQYRPGPRMAR